MFSWAYPWANVWRGPFGGDVDQDIAPVTRWFSPTIEVNGDGDPELEREILKDAATYGAQLGALTDVVQELAAKARLNSPAAGRLRELSEKVDAVKARHRARAEQRARDALTRLGEQDPRALGALLAEFKG